jgi:hypothetical protein
MELSQRPWIQVSEPTITWPLSVNSKGEIQTFLHVKIANVGKTPAVGVFFEVPFRLTYYPTDSTLKKMCNIKTDDSAFGRVGSNVFPSETLLSHEAYAVSGQAIKVANQPSSYALPDTFIGCITYRASFSRKRYYTGFVYKASFQDSNRKPIMAAHFGDDAMSGTFGRLVGPPGGTVEIQPKDITLLPWEFGNVLK